VVVYTSADQLFSEPILDRYQATTGVTVKAVYDVEAAKTVGLVNRLIAEKNHPQADVFWNSEVARTVALQQRGLLTPYHSPSAVDIPPLFKDPHGFWTGFAARARVLVYNVEQLRPSDLPDSIFELTQPQWRGRVALGYPLLGTIATHFGALYAVLGPSRTETFLKDLKANHVTIVAGNSVVRDVVADGEFPIGFTDTDDVNVAMQTGKPVDMHFPDQEGIGTLLIPNTAALIKNGPHPTEGRKLIDYLLSPAVEAALAASPSANLPLRDSVPRPASLPRLSSLKVMTVDYNRLAEHIQKSDRFCQRLFGH
jgi:iron(III) transport system substrate-binding protein